MAKRLDRDAEVQAARQALRDDAVRAVDSLTPRQREVCRLLVGGNDRTEISQLLGLSAWTVGHHLKNIHHKLGTGHMAELGYRLAQGGFQ